MGLRDLPKGELLYRMMHPRATVNRLQRLEREQRKTVKAMRRTFSGGGSGTLPGRAAGEGSRYVPRPELTVSTAIIDQGETLGSERIYKPYIDFDLPAQYKDIRGFVRYRLRITDPNGHTSEIESPDVADSITGSTAIRLFLTPTDLDHTAVPYQISAQIVSAIYGPGPWSEPIPVIADQTALKIGATSGNPMEMIEESTGTPRLMFYYSPAGARSVWQALNGPTGIEMRDSTGSLFNIHPSTGFRISGSPNFEATLANGTIFNNTDVNEVPLAANGPTGQVDNLFEARVNNVVKFAINALGAIVTGGIRARKNSGGTTSGPQGRLNVINTSSIEWTVGEDAGDTELDLTAAVKKSGIGYAELNPGATGPQILNPQLDVADLNDPTLPAGFVLVQEDTGCSHSYDPADPTFHSGAIIINLPATAGAKVIINSPPLRIPNPVYHPDMGIYGEMVHRATVATGELTSKLMSYDEDDVFLFNFDNVRVTAAPSTSSPGTLDYKRASYSTGAAYIRQQIIAESMGTATTIYITDVLLLKMAPEGSVAGNLDANARVAVRVNSGGTPSVRRRINAIGTAPISVAQADDSGNEEVDLTFTHDTSGATAGTYDLATVVIDNKGHITSATDKAGTTFPGSPANGDYFYHSNNRHFYAYTTASSINKWLSIHDELIQFVFPYGYAFSADGVIAYATPRQDRKSRVMVYNVSCMVGTTNDGSNYWKLHLVRIDSTAAATTLVTIDTSALAPDVLVRPGSQSFTIGEFQATDLLLQIELEAVGSPGGIEVYSANVVAKATS